MRVATNYNRFSDLLIAFVKDPEGKLNNLQISSPGKDDIESLYFLDFESIESLKPILDLREKKMLINSVNIWIDKLHEALLISSAKKQAQHRDYYPHFELTFTLQTGKRLSNAENYTDYSFYLNYIIPKLVHIGCHIFEIKCHDYENCSLPCAMSPFHFNA